MRGFRNTMVTLVLLVLLFGTGFICIKYYSYIFARRVYGQIFQIERVTDPSLILGGQGLAKVPEAMYSFAVAIRTKDGEIVTSSSEDRQWAVAKQGLCAEAKFYPYPPWNFSKSGTYFNARLVKLKDCPKDLKEFPGVGEVKVEEIKVKKPEVTVPEVEPPQVEAPEVNPPDVKVEPKKALENENN